MLLFETMGVSNGGWSGPPFWMKILSWVSAILKAAQQRSAVDRDALLKAYATGLRWKDGPKFMKVAIDRIFAEGDTQARQLSNARASTEMPVIEDALDQRQLIPPYVKDPSGALMEWKVTELPLTDDERAPAKLGQLGPPRCAGNITREMSITELS